MSHLFWLEHMVTEQIRRLSQRWEEERLAKEKRLAEKAAKNAAEVRAQRAQDWKMRRR